MSDDIIDKYAQPKEPDPTKDFSRDDKQKFADVSTDFRTQVSDPAHIEDSESAQHPRPTTPGSDYGTDGHFDRQAIVGKYAQPQAQEPEPAKTIEPEPE